MGPPYFPGHNPALRRAIATFFRSLLEGMLNDTRQLAPVVCGAPDDLLQSSFDRAEPLVGLHLEPKDAASCGRDGARAQGARARPLPFPAHVGSGVQKEEGRLAEEVRYAGSNGHVQHPSGTGCQPVSLGWLGCPHTYGASRHRLQAYLLKHCYKGVLGGVWRVHGPGPRLGARGRRFHKLPFVDLSPRG
jgi:hypothetical protein